MVLKNGGLLDFDKCMLLFFISNLHFFLGAPFTETKCIFSLQFDNYCITTSLMYMTQQTAAVKQRREHVAVK